MVKFKNGTSSVIRLNVKKEFQDIFDSQLNSMLADAGKHPGHISSLMIPPLADSGDYQLIQKFSAEYHLDEWRKSKEGQRWHKKLESWSQPSTYHCHFTETKAVLTLTEMLPRVRGAYKARLAAVSWLGIFPTVSVALWFGSPLLEGLPFLLRIAILTALIVPTMSYVVMPTLMRWLGWWLHKPG